MSQYLGGFWDILSSHFVARQVRSGISPARLRVLLLLTQQLLCLNGDRDFSEAMNNLGIFLVMHKVSAQFRVAPERCSFGLDVQGPRAVRKYLSDVILNNIRIGTGCREEQPVIGTIL